MTGDADPPRRRAAAGGPVRRPVTGVGPASMRDRLRGMLASSRREDQTPADVRVTATEPHPEHTLSRLLLTGPDGRRVPAVLLSPTRDRLRGVGVVAVHQHGGRFRYGKGEVAGTLGDLGMAYGLVAARAGLPVIAPDLDGFEERRTGADDPARDEQRRAWGLIALGESLQGRHLDDVWLAANAMTELDPSIRAVGMIGHSLGGQTVFFAMAADAGIRAGVASCGIGTLASFDSAGILHNPAMYVPGLRRAGDTPFLARGMAGQRLRLLAGRHDPLFPWDGVREVVRAFPDGVCDVDVFDGGHEFPPARQRDAVRWLAAELAAAAE